ncbi:trypsin-like serine protease [Streptomyces sp. NPDC006458]|uniref:trypsin-like serine protease n=1 Tax=Streptomyces sp. NPDC006458 TaxID=3154302 RepID=UPI0033ACFDAF
MRIALSLAAAGVAAAVAAVVLTQAAGAAPVLPEPTWAPPGLSTLGSGELERRVAGAVVGDVPGEPGQSATTEPARAAGTPVSSASAPWMAQLWYHDDRGTEAPSDDVNLFCAGAVVAPTKILTAAQCVKGYNWYAYGAVVTGTDRLPTPGSGTADLHGGTVALPLRQYYDPAYSPGSHTDDIAVITLDAPVKARPIRMTTSTDSAAYSPGTAAEVYGWGRSAGAGGHASPTLRGATLTTRSECATAGMCAAGAEAARCTGDTGGPLVVGGRVVGVVSGSREECAGEFTELRSHLGTVAARVDDTNFSRDHRADVFSRGTDDQVGYFKTSKGSSFDPRDETGDWEAADLVVQTDLNRDGFQDLVWRRGDDGDVFWAHYDPFHKAWQTKPVADDWASRAHIVAPGDVTGDDLPDLLSVDSAGVLWIHPGHGDGTFAAPVKAGSGWKGYDSVLGHGDFTDDGRPDLITRDATDHGVYLHQGTGRAGPEAFAAPVKVRTWKDYDVLDAVGDVNGDSRADLLARAPDGTLYLYKGTGKASAEIFDTRVAAAPDFEQYDLLG